MVVVTMKPNSAANADWRCQPLILYPPMLEPISDFFGREQHAGLHPSHKYDTPSPSSSVSTSLHTIGANRCPSLRDVETMRREKMGRGGFSGFFSVKK